VGVGINVNIDQPKFPHDIRNKTTSLKAVLTKEVSRVKLVQIFLQEFEKYYEELKREDFPSILEEWKLYSCILGKEIRVNMGEKIISGKAVDISEEGALILKKTNGELIKVISGTII